MKEWPQRAEGQRWAIESEQSKDQHWLIIGQLSASFQTNFITHIWSTWVMAMRVTEQQLAGRDGTRYVFAFS